MTRTLVEKRTRITETIFLSSFIEGTDLMVYFENTASTAAQILQMSWTKLQNLAIIQGV